MLYLTFNDAPSGIYISQVSDVCAFLNRELNARIRLVAFISLRSFFRNRKKIKASAPYSWVLPMFPGVKYWRMNIMTLVFVALFTGKTKIIARGPFATALALRLKKMHLVKKVCFDARGAYTAELNEYLVVSDQDMKDQIRRIEGYILRDSDFRLAVSEELVRYWGREFDFHAGSYVVIPCTLGQSFLGPLPEQTDADVFRKELGFGPTDVVFVYSGSSAGWQSFSLLLQLLGPLFTQNPSYRILFLTKELSPEIMNASGFKDRIVQRWLPENEVRRALSACDYGLILRESSITNQVASPVKFAEYLSSGLALLISEGIGDYSAFVKEHACGKVWTGPAAGSGLTRLTREERVRLNKLALDYFSKPVYKQQYQKFIA